MTGFIKEYKGQELLNEKRRDYRKIVILQCLIIFSALLLKDILSIIGVKDSHTLRDIIFLGLGGLYVYVLWDMLRNLTQNQWLIISMFVIIMGSYVLALITVNPIWSLFDTDLEKQPYLFYIHFVLFAVEATVIFFAIYDIFSGNKMSKEKLWGSACIYLMIAIAFGSVYDLISIAHPGSLGIPVKLGLDSYTACIAYSMTILGGQDPPFTNTIPLISNLGILESVWANLFIVLLVGRLLGQPDAEK